MHLGIVRLKYSPFGGAERIIQRLVTDLTGRGALKKISIFCGSWDAPEKFSENSCVSVTSIGITGVGRFWRQRNFFRSVSQAISQCGTVDIVQSHERLIGCDFFRTGDGVHLAWLSRLAQRRDWLGKQMLRADPYHNLICRNERTMAADPRTIFVANSPLARDEIQRFLEVPDSRIRLIPNGFDSAYWRGVQLDYELKKKSYALFGLDPKIPCVLFVGSGFERKGLPVLIMAISQMKEVQLLVVGQDKALPRYQKLANKLAPNRIKFTGGMVSAIEAFSVANVFCLPSMYDSFSNAALEALGAGIPVVISKDTGLSAYIDSGGGGLSCDRDPESIKYSLEEALANHATLSAQAGVTARKFDHSNITPLWLELYQSARYERSGM